MAYLILTSVMIASLFGVLDEWHQLDVPGRYFSFSDIALNVVGVRFGAEISRRLSVSHPG
jgi:VanZ family protein